MKYLLKLSYSVIILLLIVNNDFAQTTSYVGLIPGDSSKIRFQIKPDKNYTNVVAYINFYSTTNELLSYRGGDRIYITDNQNKWIKKNKITEKIIPHRYTNVGSVKLDRLGEEIQSSDERADDLGSIKTIRFNTAARPLKPL